MRYFYLSPPLHRGRVAKDVLQRPNSLVSTGYVWRRSHERWTLGAALFPRSGYALELALLYPMSWIAERDPSKECRLVLFSPPRPKR